MQFSTKDQDNDPGDGSCAQLYKGGLVVLQLP